MSGKNSLRLGRAAVRGALVVALVACAGTYLFSDSTTFSTYYPVPSGAYKNLNVTQSLSVNNLSLSGLLQAAALQITTSFVLPSSSAATGGSCTSAGQLRYNAAARLPEFCNGSVWNTLAASAPPPPPPPTCVPNGSCNAATPACGQTTYGQDNCGTICHKTGPACPGPCVSNGSCSASAPACGQTTTGTDNCGNSCQRTGPACTCSNKCTNYPACDTGPTYWGPNVPTCAGGVCQYEYDCAGNEINGRQVACIAAGEPVQVPGGVRPIESLAVGDAIISVEEATGKFVEGRVVARKRHPGWQTLDFQLGDRHLLVTGEHPLYDPDLRDYRLASTFKAGDRLALSDGHALTPVRITAIDPGPKKDVFDITVSSPWHNFVTHGVLVHNKCACAF